jgi:hypothetical protein
VLTQDQLITLGVITPRFQTDYVGTTVRLTPKTLYRLANASELGFMMVPPSKQIFQGWTSDFQGGKQKFFGFVNTCH